MKSMEIRRSVIRRGAMLFACNLGAAMTLFLATQAQAKGLMIEPLDGHFACPWDSTLRCARINLQAGDDGNTFNVTSSEEGVFLHAPDLQLQVWKNGRWIEFAPDLATYASPDARLCLREGATWIVYVDINSAVGSPEQRTYRVAVKDASGAIYTSAPIALTKTDEAGVRSRAQ